MFFGLIVVGTRELTHGLFSLPFRHSPRFSLSPVGGRFGASLSPVRRDGLSRRGLPQTRENRGCVAGRLSLPILSRVLGVKSEKIYSIDKLRSTDPV
jgi:hypothetical protein